ncbi:MAG: DUF1501 domain-containing protein [Gemmataceae bacterium]
MHHDASPLLNRREWLRLGSVGAAGLALPGLLRADARGELQRAKSCIFIFAWGGPPQQDTFDLKPDAVEEVRGEFKPIATNVPGIQICEHLPRLSRIADHYAIIRSATHRFRIHNPAAYYALTGRAPDRDVVEFPASRKDWPALGSVMARLHPSPSAVPSFVMMPLYMRDAGTVPTPGQHAGFMSMGFDPLFVEGDPSRSDFNIPALAPRVPVDQLAGRVGLRSSLSGRVQDWAERGQAAALDMHYQRAYGLVASAASRQAFDLTRESPITRTRYGMNRIGQSMLMARRLVESGVRLVLINDSQVNGDNKNWDTHGGNFTGMRRKLPEIDESLSALLSDLEDRGLLDSTLVIFMGEFGRTPNISGRGSPGAGRDHWPDVYSVLLAGGGIRGGQVYGASDRQAAFPRERPCSPEDIYATIYQALGVPSDAHITDAIGRELPLYQGQPLNLF